MTTDRVPCPRRCGETFTRQPLKAEVLHECSRQKNGEPYKDATYRAEIEVYVGGPDVGLETSDPKVGSNTQPRREPVVSNPGKRQRKMSTEEEEVAPKPGRGYTVVELRTAHQAEMVKDIVKGTKAGAVSIEDKWVVVKNVDAQLVVDKAIAAADKITEFEGRVVSFFLAVVLLGNDKVTDSRNTLQARLIDVGRNTKGFKVGMKSDNKLEVSVGSKKYKTQKEALMALAPDRVKAPAREAVTSEEKTTPSGVETSSTSTPDAPVEPKKTSRRAAAPKASDEVEPRFKKDAAKRAS